MNDWKDIDILDIWEEPYNKNRKLFKKSDFKKNQIILELDSVFIVKYPKGFPDNDALYSDDWFMTYEIDMKDFLCLK